MAEMQPKQLSAKQAAFVQEYPVDLNGKRAAIRAGYSAKTAAEKAYQLLRDPKVRAAIDAALEERRKRVNVDQDWVILRLVDISDSCMEGTPILDEQGNETGRTKIDAAGANRATELIGKHLGMFKEQVDHTIGLRLTHEEALAALE